MFEKAERFLPENINAYAKNIQLFPVWSPEEMTFIFKKDLDEGYEFDICNIKKCEVNPLFNHEVFAQFLKKNHRIETDKSKLPIDRIEYLQEDLVRIHVGNFKFDYQLDSSTLFYDNQFSEPLSMDHCLTTSELWGLIPTTLASSLRSPDKSWDLLWRENNIFLYSRIDHQEFQITYGGRDTSAYSKSPDTNLMSVTYRASKIDLPPIAIWSPDSKKIITFQCDQVSVEKLMLLQYVPTDGTFRPKLYESKIPFVGDLYIPEIHLCLIDVATKQLIKIQEKPLRPALVGSPFEAGYVWWNSRSDKIFFLREERSDHCLSLCELDIFSKQVRVILKECAAAYTEPSQLILWQNYTYISEKYQSFIWLSEQSGWPHLYLYDLQDGEQKNYITTGEWTVRRLLYVDEEQQWVYFLASGREPDVDPYFRFLYRAKLDGSYIELLTKEPADHTICFSPKYSYFLDSYSSMQSVPKTQLYTKDGKKLDFTIDANFTKLYALGYIHPESFCIKGEDHTTDIHGLIYKPSDFDPNKKYPVIDDIYPGPQLIRTPKSYCYDPPDNFHGPWLSQALAELGFIVVNIDGRGTPLRSREFHLYSYKHLETAGSLEDHVKIIKTLAERYYYFDIENVGIVGHSAGGYAATRAILTYPEFFKTSVCISGIQDHRTYLAFWGEKYQGLLNETDYSEQSNYPLAKNLTGDLLLIHGDMDDNVHPANMLQLANALILANKNFDMLLVPNGNHGIFFTNNYVKKKIWQFLVDHLA